MGRILKGERPENLPVQQITQAELIVNLQTAKALLSATPLSIHPSTTRLAELSVNNAEAGYAGYRKHHRRTYQHSYYRYGWNEYYVYKYPDGYPISYYGYGYSAYSVGYAPLGSTGVTGVDGAECDPDARN